MLIYYSLFTFIFVYELCPAQRWTFIYHRNCYDKPTYLYAILTYMWQTFSVYLKNTIRENLLYWQLYNTQKTIYFSKD